MKRASFKVSLDQDLLEWLRAEAARRRCSVAQVIRDLIVKEMDRS